MENICPTAVFVCSSLNVKNSISEILKGRPKFSHLEVPKGSCPTEDVKWGGGGDVCGPKMWGREEGGGMFAA